MANLSGSSLHVRSLFADSSSGSSRVLATPNRRLGVSRSDFKEWQSPLHTPRSFSGIDGRVAAAAAAAVRPMEQGFTSKSDMLVTPNGSPIRALSSCSPLAVAALSNFSGSQFSCLSPTPPSVHGSSHAEMDKFAAASASAVERTLSFDDEGNQDLSQEQLNFLSSTPSPLSVLPQSSSVSGSARISKLINREPKLVSENGTIYLPIGATLYPIRKIGEGVEHAVYEFQCKDKAIVEMYGHRFDLSKVVIKVIKGAPAGSNDEEMIQYRGRVVEVLKASHRMQQNNKIDGSKVFSEVYVSHLDLRNHENEKEDRGNFAIVERMAELLIESHGKAQGAKKFSEVEVRKGEADRWYAQLSKLTDDDFKQLAANAPIAAHDPNFKTKKGLLFAKKIFQEIFRQRKIVASDFRPDNVMFDSEGSCRITDATFDVDDYDYSYVLTQFIPDWAGRSKMDRERVDVRVIRLLNPGIPDHELGL